MKTEFVTLGAFLLVFGTALMFYGPILEGGAFYKAEASILQDQSGQNVNMTSVMATAYNQAVTTLDQAEIISLVGVAVAPVGAALLAYGLTAGRERANPAMPETAQAS